MSWGRMVRTRERPFRGPLKRAARAVLSFHIPVAGPTRWLFDSLYRVHVAVREGWIWAKRFFWFEPLFRSQCAAVGPGFWMEELPYLTGRGRIALGTGVRLSGKPSIAFSAAVRPDPELTIGDGTFVGHGCSFHVADRVTIGRHCLLAGGVAIFDMDGHPLDADARRAGRPTPPDQVRAVRLGNDVWVGAGSVILKGVTIGDRSIVAARSVVTTSVPPDTVVAGNPARVVKHLDPGPLPDDARSIGSGQPTAAVLGEMK
jgi:acetyltransferase-like isoleucine patch superfamily enzyme